MADGGVTATTRISRSGRFAGHFSCLTPAAIDAQCPRRNEPVAASSPPEKQRSAKISSQPNSRLRAILFAMPKKSAPVSPVRVKKCGGKAAMGWPLGDKALF
jgi:hypothetical protein